MYTSVGGCLPWQLDSGIHARNDKQNAFTTPSRGGEGWGEGRIRASNILSKAKTGYRPSPLFPAFSPAGEKGVTVEILDFTTPFGGEGFFACLGQGFVNPQVAFYHFVDREVFFHQLSAVVSHFLAQGGVGDELFQRSL